MRRSSALRCLLALLVATCSSVAARGSAQDSPDPSSDAPTETEQRRAPFRRSDTPREPAPEEAVESLRERIDQILADRVSDRARVGLVAVDTRTGQYLYRRNPDETFNPASNMKLLTSSAALDQFGPAHTFETELLAVEREQGTITGPLYVRGTGEAFLLFEDVVNWAAQLKLKGIDSIEGGIVIDDSIFDEAYLPPGFGQKDEDASYRSPIGAVSINFNAVTVIAEPAAEPGAEPKVRMFPPNDHVEIDNRAKTVAGSGQSLTFKSEPTKDGRTVVSIEGAVGSEFGEVRSRLRIDHPPAYAGAILERALSMVGVEVDGKIRTGETPSGAETIVSHRSKPLSYILLAMNKWSNNFMAEQLLRLLGTEGDGPSTWERSRDRLRDFLEKVGIEPDAVSIKNGSGLYSGNEVSPRHFARLLTYMLDHRTAPEFQSSLAIAGIDGTLADRLEGGAAEGRLRAKTGTLNTVSALSGYLTTESGRVVAFSMLFNETPRRAWHYRPVQDAIARELVSFDQ